MNVDMSAEMQCQNTATHRRCRKTDEAQQVPFPERGAQNIVKDAQTQRQMQMIQKMPSEIHSEVKNMLMPGSSGAAVQSPGPVFQISSRRQTNLRREKEKGSRRPQKKSRQNSEMCKRHNSTIAHNSATVQETQQHKKNDRS